MANGTVLRGEVYWIGDGTSIGAEMRTGRPGVIISSQEGIDKSDLLTVVYTTRRVNYGRLYPKVYASGEPSHVVCNQIHTVDKLRLGKYIGKLTDDEMDAVERGVLYALGIELIYDEEEAEEEEEEEVENVKEVEEREKDLIAMRVECDLYKKLYEAAMEQMVSLKLNMDVARVVVENSKPPKREPTNYDDAVERLVSARVLDETEELADEVVLDEEEEESGSQRKKFVPTLEVVNVNTATGAEIRAATGMNLNAAYSITAMRKKYGEYESLEDLLVCERFTETMLEKYRPYLTLGESVEEEPEEEPEVVEEEKLDINLAKARDFMKLGFGKSEAARIIHRRKNVGPFRNIEELTTVDGITGKMVRKVRDKLVV